ncbi:Kiwa anti-phage protein KwaB-like domain-containing protein [Nakamurella endophytica]|uniref:DUF4868 domain-containing protein n=1 Tax=Nakamurella endophytica TaxID=1748367 RepID=A0A917WAB1_9ACTN|nr:Kiwa anti-phage protein KwaB-like domain-containing protein [Nakamurella endophytica]GGL85376.1 hypothetical protein GCM10011594_01320 [Nakamurella endophytica]
MTAARPLPVDEPAGDPARHQDGAVASAVRELLGAVVDPDRFDVQLLAVADHRSASPLVYDLPLGAELAAELRAVCAGGAAEAAEAELRRHHPDFHPAPHQWLYTPLADGPLAALDAAVTTQGRLQYGRGQRFGRQNVLVFVLVDHRGEIVARMYQGFSQDKALQRKRVFGVWSGERWDSMAEPLVIDRALRVVVVGDWVVLQSARAYESLFGALPGLAEQAAQTFDRTLGRLEVVGVEQLRETCLADPRMMHKLAAVQDKLDSPQYADSITMPRLLTFLADNPHIDVPLDRSGAEPRLQYDASPQHRWQLLKLLDDDYLHSQLTERNYEATSKTEV